MAESKDDAQERTEQATPKRLKEAREKGQIARSRELNTAIVLLVSATGLLFLGPGILGDMAALMRRSFIISPAQFAADLPLLLSLEVAMLNALVTLGPFLALVAIAAILAPMSLGGWAFSPSALAFKWEKLDPIKGLKRVFSWRGLMELVKALAKFLLVAGVGAVLLWNTMGDILGLNNEPLAAALAHTGRSLMWGFFVLVSVLILIAAVDVPFQLWDHARALRMSQKEIKEEYKETEGKPEVKRRIRELQREMAQRRMMEAVPKADVVVTNPTHFAVALLYTPETMRAPRLVAKGRDLVALRIRESAHRHGVPVLRSPALARALYFNTEQDHEIPAGLYTAVAHVLAYVYRLRQHVGEGEVQPPPEDLPIPDGLR